MNANKIIQNLDQDIILKLTSTCVEKHIKIIKKAERYKILSVLDRDKALRDADRKRCLKSMRDISLTFNPDSQLEE